MLSRITPKQFETVYGATFDRVFMLREELADSWAPPFRDSSWRILALPAVQSLDPQECRALAKAAQAMGDNEAVITDVEAAPRHQFAVPLTWSPGAIREAYSEGPFGVDAALFGLSGTWGVHFLWEPYVAYLAGTPEFMSIFLAEMGGLEAVKANLRSMVDETGDPTSLADISHVLQHLGWDWEVMGEKHPSSLRTE